MGFCDKAEGEAPKNTTEWLVNPIFGENSVAQLKVADITVDAAAGQVTGNPGLLAPVFHPGAANVQIQAVNKRTLQPLATGLGFTNDDK